MSYDLVLYRTRPGASLQEIASGFPEEGQPDLRPILRLTSDEIAAVAASVSESSGPWERFDGKDRVELSLDVDGSQFFQVAFSTDGASIEIPYGQSETAKTIELVWGVLQTLRVKGFRAWDPQAGREIDLESGRAALESAFAQSSIFVTQGLGITGRSAPSSRRTLLWVGAAILAVVGVLIAIRMRWTP